MPSFPLTIAFRIFTIHPQMVVREASGTVIGYVQQSLWAFKEAVTVFADETKTKPIYKIAADRVIDFNARYAITNEAGASLGHVRRHGMRSLWKAAYEIVDANGQAEFEVHERSALVRMIDGVIGEMPLVGFLTGYFLNPVYDVARANGTPVVTMTKTRSILEANFAIAQQAPLEADERERLLLGLMMIILLERSRG